MLRERGIPTAYISTSDNLAIGIMRAAQDHSIAVPLELSVVSYGNISAAKMTQPPLTTTSGNFSKMCSDAATALIEMVDTHLSTPQRTVYPVELILRESTAKANPTAPS
jgi:DNA-binding LacI/PurR family transcriptional regulator